MQKRVMITGGAAGIGRAAADAFAAAGWFVGVYDIDDTSAAEWAAALGPERTCSGPLNVTEPTQWQTAIADFERRAGGLDVLVNNAGVLVDGPFADLEIAAQKRVIDINVTGTMNGCHAAREALTASGGRVINMSSASAFFGQPNLAAYSASKFAVRGLTEALSVEWADAGVAVSDIMPLFVNTSMVENMKDVPATRRLGVRLTPEDVAAVVVRAAQARRPKLHYCVGLQSRMLKQMLRLSPDWLSRYTNALIGSH